MPKNWIRMGREDAWQTLDRLGTQRDAVVFGKETTEVAWRALPFYSVYRLYRLVNYATLPVFSQLYLSNGIDFIALDGTAEPVYSANVKDPVRINETTAIPYLEFFFSNVQGSEGEVILIKDPRTTPLLSSLTPEQQDAVAGSFQPLRIARDEGGGEAIGVTGTLCYGGSLISASLSVMPDGKISFLDQSMLLTGIHFPHETYGQMWLEG